MTFEAKEHEGHSAALAEIAACLPDALVACYLYGSSTAGGLKPDSDIDLLIVLSRPLEPSEHSRVVQKLLLVSGSKAARGPARPIEATFVLASDVARWNYPPRNQLVYGEWLRGRLENNDIPGPATDPDLAILLHTARENSRPLIGPDASSLIAPIPLQAIHDAVVESLPKLLDDLAGDERNVVLTLARMWKTLATDKIVPKDVAATWVLGRIPRENRAVLELARDAYLGKVRDCWTDQQREVRQFSDYTASVIQELYCERRS
jgi:streptomycin 3"-adenylyltransferase